jgi:uncharacterized membrane protein YciS (DUF1049 family)
MRDVGDEQVKGMDRFIPTRRSAALLVALIVLPASVFAFFVQTHDFVLAGVPKAARLPSILAITLGLAVLIAVFLCLELAVALNHSKHRKIKHFSNEHSQMSFKWLASNASIRHYLLLAAVFTVGVVVGHYF